MTYFSHIRAGLMASALLLTTALASPALAETLPEISPRQIANDVKIEYHPETGAREYVAPSFDPFEEDRNMAGTASLRSVSNATTIDGQSIRGGALLDMTFYYNSASNDPYDTRGYEEAVYLSGEYAPVTRRDNRILECNEQVQDVVYYHEDYYRPSLYVNLFRPYRHYRGHFGYGRGYDYGRSYRGYGGYRGYRRGHDGDRRRTHNRRNTRHRDHDRAVGETRRTVTSREDRTGRRDYRDRSSSPRRLTREERRANRNGDNRETRRNNRDGRRGNTSRSDSARTIPLGANRALRMERVVTHENAPRIRNNNAATSRRGAANASGPRNAAPARATAPTPRAERAAPAPRRQRTERSRPARTERAVNRARETKSRNAPRRSNGRKGNTKLKLMGFMPMASAWSRNVVRNVDVQCAREEMLSIHIPQERLDAARFDGLTVLVLDRTGQEMPIFVPPNYIEGFRQAVNGRVTPNVSYQDPVNSAPVTREPAYQEPRPYGVQEAPCPVGTTKQNDGTCLQGGVTPYGGYPTR